MTNPYLALILALSLAWQTPANAVSFACKIALLQDDLPGHGPALGEILLNTLRTRGYDLHKIDADALSKTDSFLAENFDLLILPSSFSVPADGMTTVTRFLARGGDLVALETPAFSQLLWKSNDRWLSRAQWRKSLEEQPTADMLIDFETQNTKLFQRSTNTPKSPATTTLVGGPWGKALDVDIADMQGWDTLTIPLVKKPFRAGHRLTCFHAKGSKETRALSLEWKEKDGSRWIATFSVSEKWRRVVLAPEDFRFWESVCGRGHPGDRFSPADAAELTVGVAWTHTGPRGGAYHYALDQIGTAPDPLADPPPMLQAPIPPVEGLSPSYKFYELAAVSRLRVSSDWHLARQPLPIAKRMFAHHPRPTGKGYNKGRKWRWIPLVCAEGSRGEWRGAPVSMFVDFAGPMRGSVRASFSVVGSEWYRKPEAQVLLAQTVDRMARGVFLEEAGSEFFTVRSGEPVRIGTRVTNLSRSMLSDLRLRVELRGRGQTEPVFELTKPLTVDASHTAIFEHQVSLPDTVNNFVVTTSLFQEALLVDRITHGIDVYRTKPKPERKYVTVRDGDFWRDGSKWYGHGVNYMPSTGVAVEDQPYFEYWLGACSYDPEFVQRDLERCRDLGLNSVSIFIYHRSVKANNLLDILHRCEKLGLMVNLSIRPGTPMSYRWEWWEEIVRHCRLWEFDIIYALDIAWEPFFGTIDQRRHYDSHWRAWLEKKYGTVDAAENAWKVPAPRHDERVSSPTMAHLKIDGPHRTMVADYRLFVDDLIHAHYQEAADRIRAVDPHHLISFRMTVTGDPTFIGSKNMPYDFKGVARCMDFLAPEGYGRIGDWERIKPGIFTVAYARYCAPKKPVLWAEAGVHVWNNQRMIADPDRLAFQAQYYEDFYRMLLASHSNGIVWWWYPGGYRANERSDYGIINPDGTDRPVTGVIRRRAKAMLAPRDIPTPEVWIPINRDADARGLFGIYDRVKETFWKTIEEGKAPGLR